jgi:hypothetical protein
MMCGAMIFVADYFLPTAAKNYQNLFEHLKDDPHTYYIKKVVRR